MVGGCEGKPVVLHHLVLHLQAEPETGQSAFGAVMLTQNTHSVAEELRTSKISFQNTYNLSVIFMGVQLGLLH
jgi:hypothetical protein